MQQTLRLPFSKGEFSAYKSHPDDTNKHPGLIVIQEIWGMTDHIKDVANRFAAEGFNVIAPDLLSETGITEKIDQTIMAELHDPATRDEAQKKMREATAPLAQPEFGMDALEKLKKSFSVLLDDPMSDGTISVVGFCFGGTYTFALAAAEPKLKKAVAFYGQPPQLEQIKNIHASILAFYGEKDLRLMESLPELKEHMAEAGVSFEAIVYPNCGHAFFNDTNPVTYNAPAANDAWQKTLEFLK